jgi:hypothetical protein
MLWYPKAAGSLGFEALLGPSSPHCYLFSWEGAAWIEAGLCWLQWNGATECNVMLPLAAFPMHYYPATDTMKSCRPVQPNLAT